MRGDALRADSFRGIDVLERAFRRRWRYFGEYLHEAHRNPPIISCRCSPELFERHVSRHDGIRNTGGSLILFCFVIFFSRVFVAANFAEGGTSGPSAFPSARSATPAIARDVALLFISCQRGMEKKTGFENLSSVALDLQGPPPYATTRTRTRPALPHISYRTSRYHCVALLRSALNIFNGQLRPGIPTALTSDAREPSPHAHVLHAPNLRPCLSPLGASRGVCYLAAARVGGCGRGVGMR